jgi:uncharacterized membrane protein YfcA
LSGRRADWRVVAIFGIPAVIAGIAGALVLTLLSGITPLATYTLGDREFEITPATLVVAVLIAAFAVLELTPVFEKWKLPGRYLPLGGALSGFFGGLSGHQGALRSVALLGAGLSPAAFVGTGSAAGFGVDLARVMVYGPGVLRDAFSGTGEGNLTLVAVAIVAAFLGNLGASRLLERVTIEFIRRVVGLLLAVLAVLLATGLV